MQKMYSMQNIVTSLVTGLKDLYPEEELKSFARILCRDLFRLDTLQMYSGKDIELLPNQLETLHNIMDRLRRYEPIQYITGTTSFHGLEFRVAPDVLIPRPETEELADLIIREHKERSPVILDIGTGSGCLAVTLAAYLKKATVHAWDISAEALQIARHNAAANKCQVHFKQVDILDKKPAGEQFDVIVSNPPYITYREKEEMSANVLEWEPHQALFVADTDPLLFYRTIALHGQETLTPGGTLYFEINHQYGTETCSLLQELNYTDVKLLHDLSGKERFIKATL